MSDLVHPRHEARVEYLFRRACGVLEMPGFELQPLRRRVRGRGKLRSFRLGYTKMGEKTITVDLYTPRTMKPRKLDAILRVICHELAHHQEPPRIIRRWFHLVRLIHHPKFWTRYRCNVKALQNDHVLGTVFS
ncbi:MAG: hypothetical protein AAB879_03735 [Patescibacteria group bacterium]